MKSFKCSIENQGRITGKDVEKTDRWTSQQSKYENQIANLFTKRKIDPILNINNIRTIEGEMYSEGIEI